MLNIYAASCGDGKFVAVLQFKELSVVDENIDSFDMNDVLWAMTTRFQADIDIITLPSIHCHVLDSSNSPEYGSLIRKRGIATKAIFDCTGSIEQKDRFERSKFKDLDPEKWLSDL